MKQVEQRANQEKEEEDESPYPSNGDWEWTTTMTTSRPRWQKNSDVPLPTHSTGSTYSAHLQRILDTQ